MRVCALILCASLAACAPIPLSGYSPAIKTIPGAASGRKAYRECEDRPERQTLFHDGQTIISQVP